MLIEAGVLAAVGLVATVYRWKREQIRANRDTALAELALRDTKPCERGTIIDSLAKTRQFGQMMSLPSRVQPGTGQMPDDEAA